MWARPFGFQAPSNAQQVVDHPGVLDPSYAYGNAQAFNPRGPGPTFILEGTTGPQHGILPQPVIVIPRASGMVSAPASSYRDDSPAERKKPKRRDDSPSERKKFKRRSMSEETKENEKNKRLPKQTPTKESKHTPTKDKQKRRLINRATDEEVQNPDRPANPGHKIPALIRDEFCHVVGHYGKGHHNRDVDEVWIKHINDDATNVTDEKLKRLCWANDLEQVGSRAELINRILAHMECTTPGKIFYTRNQ